MAIQGTKRKTSWASLLFTLSLVTFIFSGLFALDGWNRERQLKIETGWPTADATINSCFVSQYRKVRAGGDFFYVYCSYSYSVNEVLYKSHTRTTSTTQSDMVALMNGWVHEHHKGQHQVLHYNPADPSQVSLAGADNEIQTQTAEAKYHAGRVVAMFALGLLIAAVIAGKVRDESSELATGAS